MDEALHLTLPRPLLHAVQAGEEDAEEYASHSLSVHGVPRDDPYNHLSEQFEVIYLGEDGAVAHRNATPPVRHYLLQSHDSAWEGTFVLTDHMETDHLYGWLNYNPDPATAASQLVVEPVNERETSGYCPPAEVEHVVYLEGALGVTIRHHNDQVSSDSGVASAAARKLLISDCPYYSPNLCVKFGYPVPPSLVDKAKEKCSGKWCKASSKCFKKWRCEDYGSPN